MKKKSGFSLLELLITIALIALLSTLAIPSFQQFYLSSQSKTVGLQLMHALHLARSEALLRHATITLCPSVDHATCGGSWADGQIIFIDFNNTAVVSNTENLLYVFPSIRQKGNLHWRASLHRNYLSFYPVSLTRSEDGSFWYCAKGMHQASWAIIVNLAGRARFVDRVDNLTTYPCE